MRAKAQLIYFHTTGWCIYSGYLYLVNLLGDPNYKFGYVAGYVTIFAAGFYASLFCLKLFKKRYGLWIGPLSILLSIVLLSVAAYYYTYKILPLAGVKLFLTPRFTFRLYLQNIIRYYLQFFSLALLYFLLMNWLGREKERIQMEFAFLRAQINPHFLYNTLNMLFSQAQAASLPLAENISRLSEIMRYTLAYAEKSDGIVLIEEELYHLELLLLLCQARFSGKLSIQRLVTGQPSGQAIPPLCLLTIVENALKYGELRDALHPLIIDIQLQPGLVRFYCSNKKQIPPGPELRASPAIGLRNLRRRMDISFRNKYEMNIENTPTKYTLSLTIQS